MRNIDYIDGDAHLFTELKMIFFFYIFVKINFRVIHRVGPPFGKGLSLNVRNIVLFAFELTLLAMFIAILFMDKIT